MFDSSSPVPATVPAESLVISEVDADVVQPEKLGKMHVQTQLQTIPATYCVEHKERAYVQPNQFRVWMQRVFLGYTDEAGERDLRLGKRFAHLTSTVADKSIEETSGHEMYVKFLGRRARRSEVHLWHPERRGVVLEQCVVSASPMWRAVLER